MFCGRSDPTDFRLRIAQWAEADARTELGPPSETSFGGNSSRGPSGPGAPQGPAGASWAGGGLLDIESEASQSEAGQGDGGGDGGGDDDLATDARCGVGGWAALL
jgi:hypothetical protein